MPAEPADGARVTASAEDRRFMRRALKLATRGWGQTSPNPMVGAVVVRDGRVVGEGWHALFGAEHAEVAALAAAGEAARGATVYLTLEPCAHHGKTPPCTEALLRAGVSRVVVAVCDPNPAARGGLELLQRAGVEVSTGVEEEEARELIAPFLFRFHGDRPWVTLKLALSLEGAIADHSRRPAWLTGTAARREVHRLRARSDAIAVGVGTACADDPLLTVREARSPRVPPRRVVFDRTARLPVTSRLARTAADVPTMLVTANASSDRARELARAGVQLVEARTLADGLRLLKQREVHDLLVEGGARLAGSLIAASLVDRLVIFQAPLILGSGALSAFETVPPATVAGANRLRVVGRRVFGSDIMTVYAFDGDAAAGLPPG